MTVKYLKMRLEGLDNGGLTGVEGSLFQTSGPAKCKYCHSEDFHLPSRTILDRTYSAQQFFIFSYFFKIFYFGSCGRLSWLNCQLSSTR